MIVVALNGEVASDSLERCRELLFGEIDANPGSTLTVDLSGVTMIDSAGLGLLVAGLKRARQKKGDLDFVRPPERLWKVFTVSGLDRVLTFAD